MATGHHLIEKDIEATMNQKIVFSLDCTTVEKSPSLTLFWAQTSCDKDTNISLTYCSGVL